MYVRMLTLMFIKTVSELFGSVASPSHVLAFTYIRENIGGVGSTACPHFIH